MKSSFDMRNKETDLTGVADRYSQLIEVSVFLLLIVPSMVLSFFVVKNGILGFKITAVATILRDIALVVLIFFFLWRNKEPICLLGLTKRYIWREIILGGLLFIPFFFGASTLDAFLLAHGFHAPSTPLPSLVIEKNMGEIILAFVLVTVVAFAEEVIFRGYLLLRFQNLWNRPVISVLLSSFIFSLGHGYEGSAGVITVGAMGMVFAAVFLWRKSLVAPMIMHFLQDFITIILMS